MSFDEFSTDEMPKHVAIIMDGNGRWAQQQDLIIPVPLGTIVKDTETDEQIAEITSEAVPKSMKKIGGKQRRLKTCN